MIEVVCRGSPAEMGRTQGAALRDKIRGAREALRSLEAFRLRQPRWLPYPVYRALAGRKARRFLAGPLAREQPQFSQRLAGLAAGAGVALDSLYLLNAMEPLLSSLGGCTACPGACSAVAVRGPRAAAGAPMVAHNFDYLPLAQPFYTVRESRPAEGYRALEFTAAPLVGALDGINETGLCVAYDYAFATDAVPGAAVPISMLICEALRRCATVGQAAEWLGGQRRRGGGLLMLADAGGDVGSLELSDTRSHLRRPVEDVLFHTNDFSAPQMREVQIPDEAVYADGSPQPLRGRRVHQSSDERNRRYRDLLAGDGVIDRDGLAAVMADHGPEGKPDDFTPCVHGSYWFTTACLQFFPAERRMRVAAKLTRCRHACGIRNAFQHSGIRSLEFT